MQKTSELIIKYANDYLLDHELVAAIVLQESENKVKAKRLENGFYNRYVKKNETIGNIPPGPVEIPVPVEAVLRSTSWGLMQIMGLVAREFGFKNVWLSDLEDRDLNLNLGCKIFAHHLKNLGSIRAALLRWNGGSNPHYDDEVFDRINNGTAKALLKS